MKPPSGQLQVLRPYPVPPEPPPDRGRLLTATQVAAELLGGTVSPAWVRRTIPGKLRLGQRTVRWYRDDVLRWIAGRRAGMPEFDPPYRIVKST